MERFRNKRVLVVGLGRTGFSLIAFFNKLGCEIRVTDIKPIFDLNKAVKKLKKIKPNPEMTFGEHRNEDFLHADVIVYSSSVDPHLPQLELARANGKEVYSEFGLAYKLCRKPIIAVCGSKGRTTTAHMIGYILKLDGKNAFVCGNQNTPLIELFTQGEHENIDYVVTEISANQSQSVPNFHPKLIVFTNIAETYPEKRFRSVSDYIETKISVIKNLSPEDCLVVNFDTLANNAFFRNVNCQTFWYSRKSFVKQGVINEIQGTHFHDRRIHCNINFHSEFKVHKMRIIGQENRENLLAAISASKALGVKDQSIQTCIEKFPGIPHRLEFVLEKNGVKFYNDSKSESMSELAKSISSFKEPIILIAGGKETEQEFEGFQDFIKHKVRVLILVGECKERLNRAIGDVTQTMLVGSFEESVLVAYQKSRTGDVILLSPGNQSSDFFRDYGERGNYYKKLIFQI